jgi:hypothetical protein
MIEAAVMDSGVRRIDKNQIPLSKLLRQEIRVYLLCSARFQCLAFGQRNETASCPLQNASAPSLSQKPFGASRGLKGLRRMAWCGCALTCRLDQRRQRDIPTCLALRQSRAKCVYPDSLSWAEIVPAVSRCNPEF